MGRGARVQGRFTDRIRIRFRRGTRASARGVGRACPPPPGLRRGLAVARLNALRAKAERPVSTRIAGCRGATLMTRPNSLFGVRTPIAGLAILMALTTALTARQAPVPLAASSPSTTIKLFDGRSLANFQTWQRLFARRPAAGGGVTRGSEITSNTRFPFVARDLRSSRHSPAQRAARTAQESVDVGRQGPPYSPHLLPPVKSSASSHPVARVPLLLPRQRERDEAVRQIRTDRSVRADPRVRCRHQQILPSIELVHRRNAAARGSERDRPELLAVGGVVHMPPTIADIASAATR